MKNTLITVVKFLLILTLGFYALQVSFWLLNKPSSIANVIGLFLTVASIIVTLTFLKKEIEKIIEKIK